jgi:hypothetical protein
VLTALHRNSTLRKIHKPFGGKLSIGLEPVAWFASVDSKEAIED